MTVRYHQRRGREIPDYVCQRDGIENATRICQDIPGAQLDHDVAELLLDTLTPLAVEPKSVMASNDWPRVDVRPCYVLPRMRCSQLSPNTFYLSM